MTDTLIMDTESQRAKVEALQRRRTARTPNAPNTPNTPNTPSIPNTPSSPPARGSKIAAAGLGMATMLGLVAAMGFASRSAATAPPAPAATIPAPQVVVVIHPADSPQGVTAGTPSSPVVLSAQPVVRAAPVTQAPAGQTNGSK